MSMKPETQLVKAAQDAMHEILMFLQFCGDDEINQSYQGFVNATERLQKALERMSVDNAEPQSITLKPCPCCGGTAEFEVCNRDANEWLVRCMVCDLNSVPDIPEITAKQWNRRV